MMNEHKADESLFHLSMSRVEADKLLWLLNRAVNTLEPKDWPTWLDGVLQRLEQFSHAKI